MGSKSSSEPKLARHVGDQYPSLESLFDAGEQVRSLTEHPGWSHVTRLLDAEVALIDRNLDGMTIPLPHAELCLLHGRKGGLRAAQAAVQAILHTADVKQAEQRAKHERDAEPSLRG